MFGYSYLGRLQHVKDVPGKSSAIQEGKIQRIQIINPLIINMKHELIVLKYNFTSVCFGTPASEVWGL